METTPKKGLGVIGIIIIILIIIVIIVFLSQKSKQAGYYTNGYSNTTTTQQNMAQPVEETTITTTTTTTTEGTTTTQGTTTSTNQAPVITLYGDNPYSIFHPGIIPECEPGLTTKCPPRTDFYTEPGYKAVDKEDGDITSKVKVTDETPNNSTMNPCRTWYKKYTVADSSGNTTTTRRTINECNGM